MNWVQSLTMAIDYIESHLTDDISIDEISRQSYASSSHFQMLFHMVMGLPVGEYIRNRRLSLAARDLQRGGKIIDVAMRYQYDTQESFSKAFARFHGIPPSKARRGNVKLFNPLSLQIIVKGGFDMAGRFVDDFVQVDWGLVDWDDADRKPAKKGLQKLFKKNDGLTDEETYQALIGWASMARRKNPGVFDALSGWILDDSAWTEDNLIENEQILMQGVLARFREQNEKLRACLTELEPSGVVNEAVFKALDRFDGELSGKPRDERLREAVTAIFTDFSVMRQRALREMIAGYTGFGHIGDMGYVNYLKECDNSLQWTLFMPETVKKHGFRINRDSFEYIEIGNVRFIGLEFAKHPEIHLSRPAESLPELLPLLPEYGTKITALCHLEHHNAGEVNVDQVNMMGYFCKAGTPVPEGYSYYDVPTTHAAYAVYSSPDFDGNYFDTAYEYTRDQILGDGVCIPYPDAYWTAEVYTEGFFAGSGAHRFGYLFSVEL